MSQRVLYGFLIQCISFTWLWAADLNAQKSKSVNEVYIDFQSSSDVVSVGKTFQWIESETNYRFAYDKRDVSDKTKQINLTLTQGRQSVAEVLMKVSEVAGLRFMQVNDIINVKRIEAKKRKPDEKIIQIVIDDIDVSGKVTDENGEGLPGVSVVEKGNLTNGTITNVNGEYKLTVSGEAILRVSFVGYETQEIAVKNRTVINVQMAEDVQKLAELVVVGFGEQKKETIVGSVSSITPADLNIPSSNVTTALAGRVAGLISYQRSGEPGEDNAEFFIRGLGTFGVNNSPLILIDNVEYTQQDLANMDPDNIESFSILKDATSTAVFGARGANGVILVTTKSGTQGKPNISVRLENSWSMPTQNVQLADPITYMKLHNEAVTTRNPLAPQPYSASKIANTEAGTNPEVFPATLWHKELFKDYTTTQRANLNITGGGNVVRYYLSTRFSQDNGILKVDKRNDFNNNIDLKNLVVRSNINIDLTPSTEFIIRFNTTLTDYIGPIEGGADIYKKAVSTNPVLYPKYYQPTEETKFNNHILFGNASLGIRGAGTFTPRPNPYADLVRGYRESSRTLLSSQFELKQDLSSITQGLDAQVMVNFNRTSGFSQIRSYKPFYYEALYNPETKSHRLIVLNEENGTEDLDYRGASPFASSRFYLQATLNYNKVFNEKHSVSGLLVYLQNSSSSSSVQGLQESLPKRNLGVSGRLNYGYKERYFLEFNFGYNGSEKFAKQHRFGFFPSIGAAWTISEEPFFASLKPIVSLLKFRASYGLVGNDAIGRADDRFFYLSQVNLRDARRGRTFGTQRTNSRPGVSISRYDNPNIGWEVAAKLNLGINFNLFDDKVQFIGNVFRDHRYNILMDRAHITPSMGLEAVVRANVGEAESQGLDFSVDYRADLGNSWWIQGRGNFTYAMGTYKVFEEPDYALGGAPWLSQVGQPIGQRWGYVAERLFVDEFEVKNSPLQFGDYGAGDIKYRDINGDGVIDVKDQVPIGYPTTPAITYGFGFSSGYKNFDFSVFFQGSARSSFWLDARRTSPFVNGRGLLKVYADSHWSEENRNIYALWPKLSGTIITNNAQRNIWFMRDGSFLRLKQLEVGYTLPQRWMNKVKIRRARIYVNGRNLMAWSPFKLWDPEMAGNGLGYPIQKVYNVGLHVQF